MKCEKCNKKHDGTFGSGKFCSLSCSKSRKRTKETRAKISKSVKKWTIENPDKVKKGENHPSFRDDARYKHVIKKHCKTCGKEFIERPYYEKEFCSPQCNPNHGGYREGSNRGNGGWYKGIRCDSTYELVWVIYRLDHNLPAERFEGCLEEDELVYYPDFIDGDTIIEIKGYYTEKVDKKCELVKRKGYNIKVIYKEDLKKEFDWVKKNYEYKHLRELYDDFKPRFSYVCSNCEKEFHTEKKRKSKHICCSKKCAMLYVRSNYDYLKQKEKVEV